MEILKVLLATIAGTSVMTAFSYFLSESFNKLWKEPVLLNLVISKSKIELTPERTNIFGWAIHYTIGLAFVLAYNWIWTTTEVDPTWFCGLIFGIISGFIGIISWYFLFKLPDEKPKIKFKHYYLQLFIAHILFAFTVISVYKIFLL